MNYIKTFKGIFNFDDIESNDINIEDIAHSLSMQCRYNGHCSKFYSVANHSLNMLEAYLTIIDPDFSRDYNDLTMEELITAKQILLHDATEAYLTDLTRPIKKLMPEYQIWEDKIESHIYDYFGLGHKRPIVKEIDNRILADEMLYLFGESFVSFEPLGCKVGEDFSQQATEYRFLEMFNSIEKLIDRKFKL